MFLIKKISKIFYWSCTIFLVIIAIATAFSVIEAPGGFRILVVSSGSMEPNIKTGSVVLILPQSKYQVGDIITYRSELNANLKKPNSTVTHRVTKVQDDEGKATFKTKGDANNSEDLKDVTSNLVLGKVILAIPLLGYLIAFTKSQAGFIALIIIPATLIIYGELMAIKKEALKLIQERKKRKLNILEEAEKNIGEEVIKAEKLIKK